MICSRFNEAFLLLSLSLSLSKCVSAKCEDSEWAERKGRKFGPSSSCLARFFQLFRVLNFSKKKGKKLKSAQNDFDSALWNLSKNDDDFNKTIKKGTTLLLSL